MKKRFQWLSILTGAVCALGLLAAARVNAQAVVQSYTADTAVRIGMIVQLSTKNGSKVQPANKDNLDHIHGVIVAPNDAPLSLSTISPDQQVYVATSGSYKVLVTDQNGPLKKGDYVSLSSLDGVGMKVSGDESLVVGKTLEDFRGTDDAQGQITLHDSQGGARTVHFGYVNVAIEVAHNPFQQSTTSNLPGFLKRASETVANKPVSYVRVYLGLVVILITAIITGSLLYAGVRTSMVALGRNPLAKSSIIRNLLQVILTSLIILISGLFGVYLLLKL